MTFLNGRVSECMLGNSRMFNLGGLNKLAEEQKLSGSNLSLSLYVTTQAYETIGEASRLWKVGNEKRPALPAVKKN